MVHAPKKTYRSKVTEYRRRLVFERDNYTCVYCGHRVDLMEIDHVVPYSAGGTNAVENLVAACWLCNHYKADMSKDEFLSSAAFQKVLQRIAEGRNFFRQENCHASA